MNKRQRATLEAIFASPTPADLQWSAIESLFRALGATIRERAGSRVAIAIEYEIAGGAGGADTAGGKAVAVRVFHRPHPRPEAPRATVQDVRDFLTQVGVTP
jgi:hypothetical protein